MPSWTRERIIVRSASANTIIMFTIISAIQLSSPDVVGASSMSGSFLARYQLSAA